MTIPHFITISKSFKMAKKAAVQPGEAPPKSTAQIINIAVGKSKIVGSRGKEEEFWEEPFQCGENGTVIKVVCTVDAVKCTFKVKSSFTTKQFHIYNEDVQIDLLQKKAVLELKAGQWGVQRCQHWNEQRGGDPNQLDMGFPGQDDEE